jgi:hypothetical protein
MAENDYTINTPSYEVIESMENFMGIMKKTDWRKHVKV